MIGEQPIALAVNKDVPVSNAAQLIALANSTPGGMLFGATNRGGQSHLTGELFRERANANISFVHAAGAAVSLNDVIAGRIPIMFEGLAGLAPGLQGGAMKLLAVAAPKRLPNLPDLPTIDETVPGVVSSGWMVLMAPAGTWAIIRRSSRSAQGHACPMCWAAPAHGHPPRLAAQTFEFMRSESVCGGRSCGSWINNQSNRSASQSREIQPITAGAISQLAMARAQCRRHDRAAARASSVFPADHGVGHGERVEYRFLGCLDRRFEQRRHGFRVHHLHAVNGASPRHTVMRGEAKEEITASVRPL
jgi:hypothetical protein